MLDKLKAWLTRPKFEDAYIPKGAPLYCKGFTRWLRRPIYKMIEVEPRVVGIVKDTYTDEDGHQCMEIDLK